MARPVAHSGDRALDALRLRNVRCFTDVTLALDPRLTVLIGDNGAGKTTVAEGIASLVAGEDEGLERFPLRHGAELGAIELEADGQTLAAWSFGPQHDERRRLPGERRVFAFGRYRRVELPPAPPSAGPVLLGPEWEAHSRSSLRDNLSKLVLGRRTTTLYRPDELLLRGLGEYLLLLHEQRSYDPGTRAALERLDEVLRAPSIGIERLEVAVRADRQVPVLHRGGGVFELGELSDGYQAILAILFDLILRYVYLFPSLANPLDGLATVVVDEVDLHLHPRWQRAVVGQLTRLFPQTQFILTTHSPAIVQGAIDGGHTIIALRPEGGEVRAVPLGRARRRSLRGAGIGSVMVDDDLFDVPSRYSEAYDRQRQVIERIGPRVKAGEANRRERRQYLAALEMMRLLLAAEEERRGEGFMAELAAAQLGLLRQIEAAVEKGEERGPHPKKRPARARPLAKRRRR